MRLDPETLVDRLQVTVALFQRIVRALGSEDIELPEEAVSELERAKEITGEHQAWNGGGP